MIDELQERNMLVSSSIVLAGMPGKTFQIAVWEKIYKCKLNNEIKDKAWEPQSENTRSQNDESVEYKGWGQMNSWTFKLFYVPKRMATVAF